MKIVIRFNDQMKLIPQKLWKSKHQSYNRYEKVKKEEKNIGIKNLVKKKEH